MRGLLRAFLIAVFAAISVLQAEAGPRGDGARGKGQIARERSQDDDTPKARWGRRDGVKDQDNSGPRWKRGRGRKPDDSGPPPWAYRDRDWNDRRGPFVQRDHDRARAGVAAGRLLPLEIVLSNVGRSIPGHHIGVDGPYQQGGRWVYRIKWLTPDGRVIIVIADAETGQILGTRGGR